MPLKTWIYFTLCWWEYKDNEDGVRKHNAGDECRYGRIPKTRIRSASTDLMVSRDANRHSTMALWESDPDWPGGMNAECRNLGHRHQTDDINKYLLISSQMHETSPAIREEFLWSLHMITRYLIWLCNATINHFNHHVDMSEDGWWRFQLRNPFEMCKLFK